MIPVVVPIGEDEMFLSWLGHLAEMNGLNIKGFANSFLGYQQAQSIRGIGNLDTVYEREKISRHFPDVETIICSHTPTFADQIYYSYAWQAKSVMHMTRSREASVLCGTDRLTKGRAGKTKVCPLCMKEDLEEYGRIIIHTPHQARGVEACWKHGVLLMTEDGEDKPVIEATPAQKKTAVFSHDIYKSDLFTDYGGVCRCIGQADGRNTDLIEDAIRTGYITDAVDADNLRTTLMSGDYKKSPKGLVGYLTYLFRNYDSLKAMFPPDDSVGFQKIFDQSIDGRYRLESEFGMVVNLTCLKCGSNFNIHPEAVLRGVGCPVCDLDTDRRVLIGRYAERLSRVWSVAVDGDDPLSDIQVIHKACGHAAGIDLRKLVWDKPVKCRFCSPHVGEKTTAENGMRITVIAYRAHDDIDIEFEDGTTVRKKRYADFKKGHIPYPHMDARIERHKRERVGETSRATNGMMMTVKDYRGSSDMDVLFEDGTVVMGVSYGNFKRGNVKHPTKPVDESLRDSRIGETVTATNGQEMKVIKYRNNLDIDVQFSDGTIVQHKTWRNFLAGKIANPKTAVHHERVGETVTANCGMEMTIIAYRTSADLDIRFEDGAVVEHRSYRDFRKGAVRHP